MLFQKFGENTSLLHFFNEPLQFLFHNKVEKIPPSGISPAQPPPAQKNEATSLIYKKLRLLSMEMAHLAHCSLQNSPKELEK